jgi:hypothetical protein
MVYGEWCNGSTTDSDSVCLGSNPGSPASKINDLDFISDRKSSQKLQLGRLWEDKMSRANEDDAGDGQPGQTVVYEISDVGFTDGIEIKQLIHLLEIQNNEGVNDALNAVEAGSAGAILRNALLSRLVLLVSRVYGTVRENDLHVARAFELLKDPAVKLEMAGRGPPGSLKQAVETWQRLRADHRLPKIKQFRDKYTAHLGEPNPAIPLPEFAELFSFADDTTELLDQLARATGARGFERLSAWNNQLKEAAQKFWRPWITAG